VNSLLILAMSSFVFHVPFQGSLVAVLFSILVYIFTGLSFGLLISTIAKTQQVAMIMTLMITMLPTIMLSGFMFPIDSMPAPFRAIALIVPPRHFLEILRGIMLKGIPIALVWDHLLFLILLSVLLIVVSVKKFKYTLE
jgi:ABC-2 type transport system permease protein